MREVGEERGSGSRKAGMAAGQGPDLRAVGQRSISSMFSNARITAGRFGDRSSPMPWLDFLARNQEKCFSQNQICQVTGGLTPEVKKRLETTGRENIHPRTTKPLEDDTCSLNSQRSMACTSGSIRPLERTNQYLRTGDEQFSNLSKCSRRNVDTVEQKQTSQEGNGREDPLHMGLSRRGSKDALEEKCVKRQQDTECRQYVGVGDKIEVSFDLCRGQKMERDTPTRLESPASQAGLRIPVNRKQRNEKGHDGQGRGYDNKEVIDLTVDEDGGIRRMEDEHGDASLDERRNDKQRKRRRLLGMDACELMESCPVCNDMFPVHMLQAHVEEELDALEMVELNAVSEEPSMPTRESESEDIGHDCGWQDQGHTGQNKISEGSVHTRQPARRSMLVLGDEPKTRRRTNSRFRKEKPAATFNHYADGGGWWDEGGVGVDAEAVGSTSVWEGLGSLSFGSML